MEDSGIDSDPKTVNHAEDERLFLGSDSSCSSSQTQASQQSTAKQLQKKLEARIEQAKRIQRNSDYIKLPSNGSENSGISNMGLIPIQRLPIPQKNKENHPLLVYWHSDRESEDEIFPLSGKKDSSKSKQDSTQRLPHSQKNKEPDPLLQYWHSDRESEDEVFPLSQNKNSSKHKQELTDTFSIEELSEGSEDSLHLGPAQSPHPHTRTYTPAGCFSCHCHIL
ncbi:uncharacterized protein LOC105696537 [Orussus abietinus]|uniref:uncharacterized protein LOC105696537 n=1 Tax=Orussus abietinus TaxID=222816 RepID=UPI000624F924|nr:uncharacterized protein LOC105696537 [Orussus abietinus]XP_012274511.1 uncharacterized protein LOC105696537 [Orussus abietinus]